jgi:hypothetical protein
VPTTFLKKLAITLADNLDDYYFVCIGLVGVQAFKKPLSLSLLMPAC